MLETVREYALDRLRAGRSARRRARTSRRAFPRRWPSKPRQSSSGPDQNEWLNRLEREYDNLTASARLAARPPDEWRTRSARSARSNVSGAPTPTWAKHAGGLRSASISRPSLRRGFERTRCGLQPARRRGRATGTQQFPCSKRPSRCYRAENRDREEVFALSELGYIALRRDDRRTRGTPLRRGAALARSLGDDRALSAVLSILSDVARTQGDHERALAYAEEALERRRALGDPTTIVDSTYHLGVAAFAAGDLDRAEEAFEAALELARSLGDALYTAAALCMLGTTGLLKDDLSLVEKRLNESLAIYLDLDDDRSRAECLSALGGYAAATGHPEKAARLWGAADAARGSRPLEYAEPAIEARFTPSLVDSLRGRASRETSAPRVDALDTRASLRACAMLLPRQERSRLALHCDEGRAVSDGDDREKRREQLAARLPG